MSTQQPTDVPDIADWNRHETSRLALGPNLSRNTPAARYAAS